MTSTLAQDLGGVVRLLEKATPGKWNHYESKYDGDVYMVQAAPPKMHVLCRYNGDGDGYTQQDVDNAAAIAAAVNFLRTHSAEIAGALRDAERLDYIERTFTGMSNGERYLPRVMGWGKSRNGRTLREACDKYMQRESAMQQGGGGGEAAA